MVADTVGDQFIYLAMDSTGKAILSWLVGKRNYRNALPLDEAGGNRLGSQVNRGPRDPHSRQKAT